MADTQIRSLVALLNACMREGWSFKMCSRVCRCTCLLKYNFAYEITSINKVFSQQGKSIRNPEHIK